MGMRSLPEGMESAEPCSSKCAAMQARGWLGSVQRSIHCALHSSRELGPTAAAAMNVTATARAAAAPTARPCTARVRHWLWNIKCNDQAYLQAASGSSADPPRLS